MKKIILSISILVFAIPQFLFGQFGWIKEFSGQGEEYINRVVKTNDGNYAFLVNSSEGFDNGIPSGTHLVKMNVDGEIIFSKKIEFHYLNLLITATTDGGFVFFSRDSISDQNEIVKISSEGEDEWQHQLEWVANGDTNPSFFEILPITNSGTIVTGQDTSLLGIQTMYIRKSDNDFNEVWTFEKSGNYRPNSTIQLANNELLVIGKNILDSIEIDFFVLKLNQNGEEIWESTLSNIVNEPINANTNYSSAEPVLLPNGNVLIFYNDIDVNKQFQIDSDGNFVSGKNINGRYSPSLIINYLPVDDGVIGSGISNHTSASEGGSAYLIKTNFEGNILWEKHFRHWGGDTLEYILYPERTPDNGIIGTGRHFTGGNNGFYIFKTDSLGEIFPAKITGKVALDEQPNCVIDSGEIEITNWIISATNNEHTFYTISDALGNYSLSLDTGEYLMTIHEPLDIWSVCENNINVSLDSNTITIQDFPMEASTDCPWLVINTSLPIARPCFDNNRYYLSYCNQGTIPATNAFVEIGIDTTLTYVNSSINLTAQNGNILTFDIGDVGIGECGNFYVDFLLDCDVALGESVCIESHIYPDSFCVTNPNWTGAFVEVDVECQDSMLQFSVENTGMGDMTSPNEYIVIEDAILLIFNNFQLLAGEVDSFSIPTNGATFQLIAEQVANAPGDPLPTAWAEGCGTNGLGNFSLGFINQFALGDNDPFTDTDCAIASASFDPNDKQGFPLGYSDEHFIRPNTDLEYLVRFQNTGTDTAFTVVVRDTIAAELDIPSIRVGAASHPYEWRIYGENILEFTFNTIMLPDSNVNEPASHGFVEFKISQKEDLPLGTVIHNQAAIYFDYNDPIITNETYHTLGENFITVSLQRPTVEDYSLKVRPNPFQDFAIFEMKKEIRDGLLELYDVNGKQVWQQKFNGKQFELHRNATLNSGIYFYKISEKGHAINSGKIIVN